MKPAGQYHHGGLRRALLEATLAIVEEQGTGAVSLSAAARRVGVSPQATYNHFRDKADMLAAIAKETVGALADAMHAAREASKSVGEGLESTGIAYVDYASTHAASFRLLSAPELADKSMHPELLGAYERAFGVLLGAIEACQGAGIVRGGDARKLGRAAWSMVHGIAWLSVDGQLATSTGASAEPLEPTRVARDSVRVLFKGLSAPTQKP
jgi:AcrR family transcriptional regulator